MPNLYPAFERQEVVVHCPGTPARSPSSTTAARAGRRGVAATGAGAPRRGPDVPPRARERGPRGRREPAALALAARLAPARSRRSQPPRRASRAGSAPRSSASWARAPCRRRARRSRPPLPVGRPAALRAADRAGRARGGRLRERAASARRSRSRPSASAACDGSRARGRLNALAPRRRATGTSSSCRG